MKTIQTSLKIALGATTLVSGLAATTAQANINTTPNNETQNPFEITDISTGYMQLAEADTKKDKKEGSCGEGKCGTKKDKMPKEVKCGYKMDEGKCGSKMDEGKCGSKKE
ncbi:MAG: hypothetical protein KAU26_09545 [Methylococcales bacterium]|nr:hypothetical protein [Methylococcales bacterium]